ncbi:MAG: DNA starvation/stationary phase protection protein [Hyphomonadaceae bacterium]|nr:DNA starvation/stationary phase protection protein [Hyphomonadaceae bacterium]
MAKASIGPAPTIDTPDTGIAKRDTKTLADALSNALADSFTLYLKTLGVHWNIVGPNFYGIHKLTQDQYEDLDAAIDVIAERIRALGHLAPAAFGDFENRSVIESKTTLSDARSMVQTLVADNEALAKRFREAVKVAEEGDDVVTADLLTERIGRHEHNAWMLRASAA